jgi:hypothetical protein
MVRPRVADPSDGRAAVGLIAATECREDGPADRGAAQRAARGDAYCQVPSRSMHVR